MTPRLVTTVCVAVLLACCTVESRRVQAQQSVDSAALIEWSADRPLTIKDFRGKVPARDAESSSRSWVAIQAAWECEGGKASWHARAVFDPGKSFWRPIARDLWQAADDPSLLAPKDDGGAALLAHEQLHFDLTEVWARRILDLLKTLPAACKTPSGAHGFDTVVAEMERDWRDEQQRYDKETVHGTDFRAQRTWAVKTAKALKDHSAAR
jgi:hypothetical protein